MAQAPLSDPDCLIEIVLVGHVGCGKSASGNTILGREEFESSWHFSTVTKTCERKREVVCGRKISLVDTPGLDCAEVSSYELFLSLKKETYKIIDIFLLVIQLGRFTEEQNAAVQKMEDIFGEEVREFTMILFTHGDMLKRTSIEDYIQNAGEPLGQVVQRYGQRYHVFNNESGPPSQVTELFEKINRMRTVVHNRSYYFFSPGAKKSEFLLYISMKMGLRFRYVVRKMRFEMSIINGIPYLSVMEDIMEYDVKRLEERKRLEEERKRLEEERKRLEEGKRLEEDGKRREEERERCEEEREIIEEEGKRLEEERKRLEEEGKRLEEEGKRLEEEGKGLEEERKRREEERKRREEERKRHEEERQECLAMGSTSLMWINVSMLREGNVERKILEKRKRLEEERKIREERERCEEERKRRNEMEIIFEETWRCGCVERNRSERLQERERLEKARDRLEEEIERLEEERERREEERKRREEERKRREEERERREEMEIIFEEMWSCGNLERKRLEEERERREEERERREEERERREEERKRREEERERSEEVRKRREEEVRKRREEEVRKRREEEERKRREEAERKRREEEKSDCTCM